MGKEERKVGRGGRQRRKEGKEEAGWRYDDDDDADNAF